jgi:hypothetical protein
MNIKVERQIIYFSYIAIMVQEEGAVHRPGILCVVYEIIFYLHVFHAFPLCNGWAHFHI